MLRQVVPARGSILGHCYYDGTERDLSIGANEKIDGYCASDALPYVVTSDLSSREIYLRVALPHYARVVEAYLDLQCTTGGTNGVKIALTSVVDLTPIPLSQLQIDDMWRLVRGSDMPEAAVGGRIHIDGLSLKPVLQKAAGDGEFIALVLSFTSHPQQFRIEKLNILLGTEVLV